MSNCQGQQARQVQHSMARMGIFLFMLTCLCGLFLANPHITYGKSLSSADAQPVLAPVYLYHVVQPDKRWRYILSTNPNFGQGWTLDGSAFYAYAQPETGVIPIYQYHALRKHGVLRYTFSTQSLFET